MPEREYIEPALHRRQKNLYHLRKLWESLPLSLPSEQSDAIAHAICMVEKDVEEWAAHRDKYDNTILDWEPENVA